MSAGQDMKDLFANLTWPLRGRRVTMEFEKRVWDELNTIRWTEVQRLKEDVHELRQALAQAQESLIALRQEVRELQFERVRAEGYLKGEVAALGRQLDVGMLASEKLLRGNLSLMHTELAKFRSENIPGS